MLRLGGVLVPDRVLDGDVSVGGVVDAGGVDEHQREAARGEQHNGAAGLPEALALKVAAAAVDALVARGAPPDQIALTELLGVVQRKDLRKKVATALGAESSG